MIKAKTKKLKRKKKVAKKTKEVVLEKAGIIMDIPEDLLKEVEREEDVPIVTPRLLKKKWVAFIDEYIINGNNGTEAYIKVYVNCQSRDAARTASARLLQNVCIREEINHRYNAQTVTDDYIISELQDLVALHKSGKGAIVAMKSLECLAKVKGMLVDTKKIAFTGENPAVFLPVYSAKEKEEFDKIKETKQRIVE